MIENNKQYEITKKQVKLFRKAMYKFNMIETIKQTGSEELARAEYEALKSVYDELEQQIKEYDLETDLQDLERIQELRNIYGIE